MENFNKALLFSIIMSSDEHNESDENENEHQIDDINETRYEKYIQDKDYKDNDLNLEDY